jgi:ABC-2 type transport system permease protein
MEDIMKQLYTVFSFEFMNYAGRKSFRFLTIGLIIIIALVLSLPRIGEAVSDAKEEAPQDRELTRILFIDGAEGAGGDLEYYNESLKYAGFTFVSEPINQSEAEKKVDAGEYDNAVIVTGPLEYIRIARNISMNDRFSYQLENAMLHRYKQLSFGAYGISDGEVDSILNASVTGTVRIIGKDQMENFFYTYILIFVLYFAIILYGQLVASSVATEKSSRAMELLITSTDPRSLMFGKVLGTSLAGFLQLALILGSAYLFYNLNASYYTDVAIIQSIFAIPLSMLLYNLLFFVFGFLLYAFLYASLASLVSRMEELSTVIMPVTFLCIIAFMIVMFSMSAGSVDNPLMVACSFIPFTSPMAMFTRIAMGDVASWQIALSVTILIGSTIGVGLLAASIYRLGVLLYGTPPKPNQIIRMLKANRAQRVMR